MSSYIYTLMEPDNELIVYVGCTMNPHQRFQTYCRAADLGNKRKMEWLKSIKARGIKPVMNIIEELESIGFADEREQYWIKHYRGLNSELFNAKSYRNT